MTDKLLECKIKIRDLKEELLRIAVIQEYLSHETNRFQYKKEQYENDLRLFENILKQGKELEEKTQVE